MKRMKLSTGRGILIRNRAFWLATIVCVGMVVLLSYPSGAMAAEGNSGKLEIGQGMPSVADLFATSPVINSILLAMSVVSLVMLIYLLLALTAGAFHPKRFVDDVTKLVINRQFEQAEHLCQTNQQVFVSSVVQRVIENRDKDHGVLMDILSAEGNRRAEIFWNRIGYLGEISNIAPMLGLLGTVIGMLKVFFSLQISSAGRDVGRLAAGIAEAMGTTMFGLVVAIAAGIFYTIVKGKATAMLAEAEQVCHAVADHTHRAAADPRLKKIDALAEAARKKLSKGSTGTSE